MISEQWKPNPHGVFIIAEAGVNHNGDLALAKKLIDVAINAGADAIKFQTFKTENVVIKNAPKCEYQQRTTDADESQFNMLKKLELTYEDHLELMNICKKKGLRFLSTPFDEESADFLEKIGVDWIKIPSGEITNYPLLKHIAKKGKPLIVSTGMANLSEVRSALKILNDSGSNQIVILHCTSNYPADPKNVNLRAMLTMAEEFQVPIGYSDHTPGIEISLAAVALGACVIEKHFTLDHDLPGPDHVASLEPEELKRLVEGIRTVEVSLGNGRKERCSTEEGVAAVIRKSLVASRDLPSGVIIQKNMFVARRPGTGIPPADEEKVLGKTLSKKISEGELLTYDHLL
jgi:N,N'-diacetyllegionaminate synthase